jgi:integrase
MAAQRKWRPRDPLDCFFRDYYRPQRLRGGSEKTLRLYRNSLKNFRNFLGRAPRLSDLTDESVGALMAWTLGRGKSPRTANKFRDQMLALWRAACRKGWLKIWPDVEAMREPEKIPRAWTPSELSRLFSACDSEGGQICGVPARLWWRALHDVAWDTGERIAALLLIECDWLSLDDARLWISASARKGKRRDRFHKLHPETIKRLRLMRMPKRSVVFCWPYSASYIYNRYNRILERAGLPHSREFKFHCLRKSVATHGKLAGLNPRELMDHADTRTTVRYLDPAQLSQPHPADVLFRP